MAARQKPLSWVMSVLAVVVAACAATVQAATPVRRSIRRTALELIAPKIGTPLLSLLPARLEVPCHYTGEGELSFNLVEGPAGMTIDEHAGVVEWTPPLAAEGTAVLVRIGATDGTATDELAFTLDVASTQPLASTVTVSTLTITAPGTLTGVRFSFPGTANPSVGEITASLVPTTAAPDLPDGLTRMSDFFRLSPVVSPETPIVITAPAMLVPAGRLPERLRLMVHTSTALDADEPLWVAMWASLDVLPSGAVTMETAALGELSCFAVADEQGGATVTTAEITRNVAVLESGHSAAFAAAMTCAPLLLSKGTPDTWRQVCTMATNPPLTVVFKNLGLNRWQPAPTAAEIAGWIVAAREVITSLHMTTDNRFEVVIEALKPGRLGFVSKVEGYRVLHLSSADRPKVLMQGTSAHEYFHHAQSNTRVAGLNNLLWDAYETRKWLTEGTARWFEDELFDDLDSYRTKEPEPLPAILYEGLAAPPVRTLPETRAYSRFAFFKLVSNRCPELNLATAFNTILAWDNNGLEALTDSLAAWQCSFAAGLAGVQTSSLGAALLEYAYATIGQNSMGWLDDDEPSFSFDDPTRTLYPDKACTGSGTCPKWAGGLLKVFPAGVTPFRIAAVEPLPAATKAVLQIDTYGTPVKAWIGNDETGSLTTGRWYTVDGTISHVYGGTRAPRLLLLLVNEDRSGAVQVAVRARLQSTAPADVVTPFDLAWSYAAADPVVENGLRGAVTWSATSSGTVTAPETATVGPATSPWGGEAVRMVRVCVPNTTAFTLRMSATLQATTAQLSGRIPHPAIADSWLNWEYSNPHLKIFFNDPNGSISGDTMSFTIPVVKGAWFGSTRGGCVAYRLKTWVTDKEGKDGPPNLTEEACQGSFNLDLQVGSPPPGCD